MNLITCKQAKEADSNSWMTSQEMIETASELASKRIVEIIKELKLVKPKILVIAWKWNNWKDWLLIADKLRSIGYTCDINTNNYNYDIIIDALFWVGIRLPIEDKDTIELINNINSSWAFIVSIDTPSWFLVNANETITFSYPKLEQIASWNTWKITCIDIGIPKTCFPDNLPEMLDNIQIQTRSLKCHKHSVWHLLVIWGSTWKTWAPILASKAASRAWSWLVTLWVSNNLYNIYASHLIEEMLIPVQNCKKWYISINGFKQLKEGINWYSSILIGPWMWTYARGSEIVTNLIKSYNKPIVIDADWINNLILSKPFKNNNIIITPHLGEASKLFGTPKEELIYKCSYLAKEYNMYIVLKSNIICIWTPEGKMIVSDLWGRELATAWSWDVLAWIIASLVWQSAYWNDILNAIKVWVALHWLSWNICQNKIGIEGTIATDLIANIPEALFKLKTKYYDSIN